MMIEAESKNRLSQHRMKQDATSEKACASLSQLVPEVQPCCPAMYLRFFFLMISIIWSEKEAGERERGEEIREKTKRGGQERGAEM